MRPAGRGRRATTLAVVVSVPLVLVTACVDPTPRIDPVQCRGIEHSWNEYVAARADGELDRQEAHAARRELTDTWDALLSDGSGSVEFDEVVRTAERNLLDAWNGPTEADHATGRTSFVNGLAAIELYCTRGGQPVALDVDGVPLDAPAPDPAADGGGGGPTHD